MSMNLHGWSKRIHVGGSRRRSWITLAALLAAGTLSRPASALSMGLTSYYDTRANAEYIFYIDQNGAIDGLTHNASGWRWFPVIGGVDPSNGDYASLTSYFDGTNGHLFYTNRPSGLGMVYEVSGSPPAGPAKTMSGTGGTPSYAIESATLTGYWDGSTGHLFYQNSFDGYLHEFRGNNGQWSDLSLGVGPQDSSGQPEAVDGLFLTSLWDGGVGHVYFNSHTQQFQELYFYNNNWWGGFGQDDNNVAFGMLVAASPSYGLQAVYGSPPANGGHWGDLTQTVNICHDYGSWSCSPTSVGANEYGQLQPTLAYRVSSTVEVYVVGGDQRLYSPGQTFPTNPLAQISIYPPWYSPITGFWDGSYEHVFYIGTDSHVHELYRQTFGAGFFTNDLMGTGAPLSAN